MPQESCHSIGFGAAAPAVFDGGRPTFPFRVKGSLSQQDTDKGSPIVCYSRWSPHFVVSVLVGEREERTAHAAAMRGDF